MTETFAERALVTPWPTMEAIHLQAGYGKKRVVDGIDIHLDQNEIVALIGHNGAGKSTILRTLFGLIAPTEGRVVVKGSPVINPTVEMMLNLGFAYVPQGGCVFPHLTVEENLKLAIFSLADPTSWKTSAERVLGLFPGLESRLRNKAGVLSGGEKQMLALATVLIRSPRVLLLDEPSAGLAPARVKELFLHLVVIAKELQLSILAVEQKVREILQIAQRVYVLRNGRLSYEGTPDSLDERLLREVYF